MTRHDLSEFPDVSAFLQRPLPLMILRRAQELIWTIRRLRGRSTAHDTASTAAPQQAQAVEPVTFGIIISCVGSGNIAATFDSLGRQGDIAVETILWTVDSLPAAYAGAAKTSRVAHDLAAAVGTTTCDFLIVLDAGDILVPGALACLTKAIRGSDSDVVYGDEAQARAGASDPTPCLKPAWSPELLESFNYFGHPTAIRRSIAVQALEASPGVSTMSRATPSAAATEWDFYLRVTERTQAIVRVQETLCHRTSSGARCAASSETAAHVSVLEDYWQRQGSPAQVHSHDDGTFHAEWPLPEEPLVSVIIPNRDRANLLRACVEGLFERTHYKNIELIIVDNGSSEPETKTLYAEIVARDGRIIACDQEFNYSRACNMGAAAARGDLLLFLNNDIEMIESDWLTHLVRAATRPGVGIVGPKLLYPDGAIQHAGVVIGLFTLAAHVFHRASNEWGPLGSPDTTRNWSAVTGACQLVSRAVFDLVGGYDETFIVAYSDVILCLDARKLGFRTVYAAQSRLVHHEGQTRGFENPTYDQVVFARRLRALGITNDPFFHKALDPFAFSPTMGTGTRDAASPTPVQEDIVYLTRDDPPADVLDIYDDGRMAEALGRPWNKIAHPTIAAGVVDGVEAMAQTMIGLLRLRSDLRIRFPRALSDGPSGLFAVWMKDQVVGLLGLDRSGAEWVDAAFAANFAAPARHWLTCDEALRRAEPLFLLPSGRQATCRSLFDASDNEHLSLTSIWWFLLEAAEDPSRELCATWAITPAWQAAIPAGGSAFGTLDLIRWVFETYGVKQDWLFAQHFPPYGSAAQMRLAYGANPDWRADFPNALDDPSEAAALLTSLATGKRPTSFLARAWLAEQDIAQLSKDMTRTGVNILGHFAYPSGLRVSTESLVEGLHANDVATSLRNVPVAQQYDEPIGHAFAGCEIYDITIVHVQPTPFFDQAFERAGLFPRVPRTYRIGLWYWELDTIPSEWDRLALDCDEIWAATRFVADGLRQRYRQPVHVFLPGIEIPRFTPLPRAHFKIEDDAFLFLFVFHMRSIMERKNPLAVIKAFKLAFAPSDKARLVIKTMSGADVPDEFAKLQAAATDENIILIDEVYTREETLSLIACCDAYVSLHRSEGLGLTMAEAMLLGRPVVATRYSGNLDFMDDGNSLLVDCALVTIDRPTPPYTTGQKWAEASIPEAAAHMRRLFDDPAGARALGARAKADLEGRLSHRAAGARTKARLAAIKAGDPR